MPVVTLTDLAIRNLKTDSRATYFDAALKGFAVRVSVSGVKTFVIVHGKEQDRKWETIGRYDPRHLTLAMARKKAGDRLAAIRLGLVDDRASMSVQEAFEVFKQTHTSQKNRARTAKETERLIAKHLLPDLGPKRLADATTQEVAEIVDRLLPTPGTAFHVFAAARLFFRWAAKRRLLDRSPVEFLPPPVTIRSRDRVLSDQELAAVFKAAGDGSTFGNILQLLILTGQRRNQIANLRAEYIDYDAKTIIWPAAEMKGDRSHTIPYGDLAAAILETLPKEGFLLRARGKAESAFSGFSKAKPLFDRQLENLEPWVIHDLRRTFASGLQALGIRIEVTEKLLAHTSGSMAGIVGIYQRHTYKDEMREAVERWETKIASLLNAPGASTT